MTETKKPEADKSKDWKAPEKDAPVDYRDMGQNVNKVITDEVNDITSIGKDAMIDELHKYGYMAANTGNDAQWLASKVRALRHAQLAEHELTPEGYKLMLKDFEGK